MGKLRIVGIGEKIKFECIRCDLCCGTGPNVSLTIYDAVRLAKKVDVNIEDFLRTYVKVIVADMMPVMLLQGDAKGRCVFLGFDRNEKTFCKVYDSRPMKCRLYPVILFKLSLDKVAIDEECPGVNRDGDRQIDKNEAEIYMEELKKHYSILHRLIVEEGREPLEALNRALKIAIAELSEKAGENLL
ncbi:MAG: YkgJ family cysteine cluster protein [Fervidicoccaceae archaeon]